MSQKWLKKNRLGAWLVNCGYLVLSWTILVNVQTNFKTLYFYKTSCINKLLLKVLTYVNSDYKMYFILNTNLRDFIQNIDIDQTVQTAWIPFMPSRAFNIFQVYQYFTIYRWYLFIKFWTISWISYTTLFKIRRYQRPF